MGVSTERQQVLIEHRLGVDDDYETISSVPLQAVKEATQERFTDRQDKTSTEPNSGPTNHRRPCFTVLSIVTSPFPLITRDLKPESDMEPLSTPPPFISSSTTVFKRRFNAERKVQIVVSNWHNTFATTDSHMLARLLGSQMQNPQAGLALQTSTMQLSQLKSLPLHPYDGSVTRYLDCLNHLIEPLIMVHGKQGQRRWLVEVQALMHALEQRCWRGMPLSQQELQACVNFAAYWRQMVHPPFEMGLPECQLVLISFHELVHRCLS